MPSNIDNTPKARLKKRYRDDNRIDRLLYLDNPLSIETCYIQLALTKESVLKTIQSEKPKDLSNSAEKTSFLVRYCWLHVCECIAYIQEKIELEAILQAMKNYQNSLKELQILVKVL